MLTPSRFREIAARYASLKIALVGDFCLDRYLEIDPARGETSIETGLPVYNVVNVRAQPGGAGTILNNLCALGVGQIHPLGFCGDDGEGYELRRAVEQLPGVAKDSLVTTRERRTFTYCKPLVVAPGEPPRELNRLDSKNWTPTPSAVADELIARLRDVAARVDAIILLDQVDLADTGVVTSRLLAAVREIAAARPNVWIMADSRRGLATFPPVCFKMNRAELAQMTRSPATSDIAGVQRMAGELAQRNGRHVFVTLSEDGIVGASPAGETAHARALPVRGTIDIVGAGDCVTANLTTALAARASLGEALAIAMAASSEVIHQLGTTGTASVSQIAALLS